MVEHRSPKPGVAGSIPATPATGFVLGEIKVLFSLSALLLGFEWIDMAKVTPAQFVRQVRQEVAKVSWPSRKETGIGTLMVFIMVFLAAGFFFIVDLALSWGVQMILGLGG